MPVFFTFIAAGLLVGYLGLVNNDRLTLIGIALVAIGLIGSAAMQVRRRERDRRLDERDGFLTQR